ncbi:MAG: DUF5686 family protein [Paludibacter sp.]|nr:DUF5686 family protein [Paludibacter sp.]
MIKNYPSKLYTIIRSVNHRSVFICILLLLTLFTSSVKAEETLVVGQVLNSTDRSPIPSVNISFKNSLTGVQTNEEGYFMIRTNDNQNTLQFSSVGFKNHEIKIKPGKSVGIQVEMQEQNTLLQEVFVVPGSNPALEMMKKVRYLVKVNDITRQKGFTVQSTEQNMVLLSKISQQAVSKRIFDQLKKGKISGTDSSMVIPLYMVEKKYRITNTEKKELSTKKFSSLESGEKVLEKLAGELNTDLNFYDNSVTVFGKNMVSPLSVMGNAFYEYFLADSIKTTHGKQYEIHFRSRNKKNLAFDGKLWVDSTTYSLTQIEAELPARANINFIHNLRIIQKFTSTATNRWMRESEELTLNMTYALLSDSLHLRPEIFVKRSATFHSAHAAEMQDNKFAKSKYDQTTLDQKLNELNNTPLLRTAKWLADVVITGYIPLGIIDFGKVEQLARITDIEGLRLNVPFRTNERLWKNISLGGYAGYGFKNEAVKYSAIAQYKFKGEKRRVLSLSYTDDYRRIDYNYNNFMYLENPLVTGDADISSSIISLESEGKISERKEYLLSVTNDWNPDIESNLYLRSNQLFANDDMPMRVGTVSMAKYLGQQSATLSTRFSFGERTYDDHMQRIYVVNNLPVIYGILEAGKYQFGNTKGQYSKIMGAVRQLIRFDYGQFNYAVNGGVILGNVPYPILGIPPGNETGGYSFYSFNLMDNMEYAADKYINLHTELMLNGLVMNQIPLVKNLNLREMFSFKMAYGSLSDSHRNLLDYPAYLKPWTKPYMEVGVGFTNIFHIFTLQSVWRLTDLKHKDARSWGLLGSLNVSF